MAWPDLAITDLYTAIITKINSGFTSVSKLFKDQTTGDFADQIRYSSSAKRLEYWSGTAWVALDISATAITPTSKTGSGSTVVMQDTPTLTTPILGNASATRVSEAKVAMSAANIDLSTGALFTKTVTGNITFTVSNPPSSDKVGTFILELTNAGLFTITFWSGIDWPNGAVPLFSSAGTDSIVFYTYDGGTNWKGMLMGSDFK